MDNMNHNQPTSNLPTEEMLLQLAQEHNVEPVLEALDALAQSSEKSELAGKLETIGLKVELARIFGSAHTALVQLYDQRPEAAKADAEQVLQDKALATQQVHEFEENISGYLKSFRESLDSTASKASEATLDFAPLKTRLSDEATREQAFQRLSAISEVPSGQTDWIREQARDTGLSVTEILWDVVGVGRDFIGLSVNEEEREAAKAAFEDWQQGVENDLPQAQKLLAEAVGWLTK